MDAALFLMQHGRFPKIEDDPKPWAYRGWLRLYVQALHGQGLCGDRWGHWYQTITEERLLDEPIPRVGFHGRDDGVIRAIEKALRTMERRTPWEQLRMFVEWLAWGLGVAAEPSRLDPDEQERLYRGVDLGPWLAKPYDYLGEVIAQHHAGGWNPNAFFPTPHDLCEAIVIMIMHPGDNRAHTVHDPCVGSGRMLLHAANHSYRLSGQDVDPLMVAVCKVNGVLYAPWLSYPLPDTFFLAQGARPAMATGVQLQLFEEGRA